MNLIRAVNSLKNGDIIVFPTDTQYAFGADIFNEVSIKNLFKIKNRPLNNPIPIAVANYNDILKFTLKNQYIKNIYEHFFPGKLTIILYKKENISNLITGGKDKIAIRIPNNKIALELLKKFGPLTVTSANLHGKKTESSIEEIKLQFKNDINCFLNDGILDNNPSTIVDLTHKKPKLIRKGSISLNDILAVI